jgi:hypothetical protein
LFPLGDFISCPKNGWASQLMRNPKGCGRFIEEKREVRKKQR